MSENIVAPARKELRHLVGAADKILLMASVGHQHRKRPSSGRLDFYRERGNAYRLRQAILAQVLYCRWISTEAGEWV
jgi:hypothetical protein